MRRFSAFGHQSLLVRVLKRAATGLPCITGHLPPLPEVPSIMSVSPFLAAWAAPPGWAAGPNSAEGVPVSGSGPAQWSVVSHGEDNCESPKF